MKRRGTDAGRGQAWNTSRWAVLWDGRGGGGRVRQMVATTKNCYLLWAVETVG